MNLTAPLDRPAVTAFSSLAMAVPETKIEGRYEILAKLGEGCFGVVYEARQATTGQSVAIKVMLAPPDCDEHSDTREKRFRREATLCAGLNHPNIVPLLDSGRTDDGRFYTVFSYIPGITLAQCLAQEGALEPREAQHLMLQVLDALTCAHGRGIIHRDLKPSNVMLVPTGARRNATVLDFGIGRDIICQTGTPITATRESLGTLGYVAPEQWRGGAPAPNADLFAWGIIFLECLTGKRVYDGTSAAQILFQHLGSEPVPIPSVLERHPVGDVIRRATCKDPALRQVTARELFESLDACSIRDLTRDMLSGESSTRLGPTLASGTRASRGRDQTISDRAELRQVTALCCAFDVISTAGRNSSESELDEALQTGIAVAAKTMRERGGHVVTTLGNRLLAYFGYPHAEEDDASRAGRAAKDIQSQFRENNFSFASLGVHIKERMALHTGLVLTQRGNAYDDLALPVGVTSTIAGDVAAIAPQAAILLTDSTRNLLRHRFVVDAQGSCLINGVTVNLYQLGDERGESDLDGSLDVQQSPLIGREEEIALLLSRWNRTAAGAGQCILVTGEAGIGKSRLLREFRCRIQRQDHAFGEGHCSANAQKHPLYPVIDLLEGLLGLDGDASSADQSEHLKRELGAYQLLAPEYLVLLSELLGLPVDTPNPLADISPEKHKEMAWNALLALLAAMAEKQPVLLAIEDCQYADPTTCEFLNELLREAGSARICVLLTARPEFSCPFSTMGLLQLQLNRLDEQQVLALAGAVAKNKALPPVVLQQVSQRTDGVPLFVEELTRTLLNSRSFVEREDQYELVGELSDLEIPTTLRALLTARLDRLGRAKETAQLAAAMGREFNRELLSLVSPGGRINVHSDLERLVNAGLILQRRRSDDRQCVFRHALICDAAYESLPPAARIQTHACIASTLEQSFPATVNQRPDLLAHHHALADQKPQAVRYAQAAALLALNRSSYSEALSSVSDVFSWIASLPHRERVSAELQASSIKTQALMAMRGWGDPEVKALVDRSVALLAQLEGSSELKVQSGWAKFAFYHTTSDRLGALKAAEELVELAEQASDAAFLAAAYTMVGLARQVDGSFEDAACALDLAMMHYQGVDRDSARKFQMDSRALAESIQGQLAFWTQGDCVRAFKLVEDAVAWARELQHIPSIAIALLYGAQVHQAAGAKQKVAAMASEILALSAKYGLPAFEGYAATMFAWAADDVARIDGVISQLELLGCKIGLSYWASFSADITANRGQFDEAIACTRRCLVRCDENNEHYFEPELHRRLGEYLLARNPQDEKNAQAALERAASLAQQQTMYRVEIMARLALQRHFGSHAGPSTRIQDLLLEYPWLRNVSTSESTFESRTTQRRVTAHGR